MASHFQYKHSEIVLFFQISFVFHYFFFILEFLDLDNNQPGGFGITPELFRSTDFSEMSDKQRPSFNNAWTLWPVISVFLISLSSKSKNSL